VARSGAGLVRLLAERGVPERAARIYIAASREGPQTASELARMSGIHRVETYRHIQQLHEAGLLRSVGGRPMRFRALSAEELLERWIRTTSEDLRRLEAGRDQLIRDFQEQIATPEVTDGRKFVVMERRKALYSFLRKQIGLARKEILLSLSPSALARFIDGGIDRELRTAMQRGVRVRVITEINRGNLPDAKHFATFAEIRNTRTMPAARGVLFDKAGAVVYVAGDLRPGGDEDRLVTVWTTDQEFLNLVRIQFHELWNHCAPSEQRIVELEEPRAASLPVRLGHEAESFNRLREITQLGMQVGGLRELPFDLPEFIDTVARQVGREIASELDGEIPLEVARSLQSYYRDHGLRFEILQPDPLLLRADGCIACDGASPEVGRLLCPAILRTIFEARTGGRWEVARPETHKRGQGGHIFALSPL
jgi:HTH-type transcriptional regulator, sugar sensing transcriptional regulator